MDVGNTDAVGTLADQFDPTMDYHMLACSGAETYNIIPYHSVPNGETKPRARGRLGTASFWELPQLDRGFLDENTTLVTMSVGGNDAGWSKVIEYCALSDFGGNCYDETMPGTTQPLGDHLPEHIRDEVVPAVKVVIQEIKKKAPNAKIMLMGYPQLMSHAIPCGVGFSEEELDWFDDMAVYLSQQLAQTAADLRNWEDIEVYYASPIQAFQDHGVCAAEEGIHGIIKKGTPGEGELGLKEVSRQSFHPNRLGAQLYASVADDWYMENV